MKRANFALALLLAASLVSPEVLGQTAFTWSPTPSDSAQCTSVLEGPLHEWAFPPTGEDLDFFSSTTVTGQPNIMLLVGNSPTMLMLPTPIDVSAGTGCSNTALNAITDTAGQTYRSGTEYSKPDSSFSDLFLRDTYYTYDFALPVASAATGAGMSSQTIRFPDGWNETGSASGNDSVGYTILEDSGKQNGACTRACRGSSDANCISNCRSCLTPTASGGLGRGYFISPTTNTATGNGVNSDAYVRNCSGFGACGTGIVFRGNWLNFHPPKFATIRKLLVDEINKYGSTSASPRIHLGVALMSASSCTGNSIDVTKGMRQAYSGQMAVDGAAVKNPGNNPAPMFDLCPSCGNSTANNCVNSGVNTITATSSLTFTDGANPTPGTGNSKLCAPLGESLFNIGQYFSSTYPTGLNRWTELFGSSPSWTKDAWFDPGGTAESWCESCQSVSVIILSDGTVSADGQLPTRVTDTTAYPCKVNGRVLNLSATDYLPKVACFLRNTDLRANTATTGTDGDVSTGTQMITTHAIGIGRDSGILRRTAKAGGGQYAVATDAASLNATLEQFIANIASGTTSFSVANVSAVQSNAASGALYPRFTPTLDRFWEGHLMRFELYSEFAAGCNPASAATDTRNLNGDSDCDDVFILEKPSAGATAPGDRVVQEDKDGNFWKVNPRVVDTSGNYAKKLVSGFPAAAEPFWDAGSLIPNSATSSRKVYTAVPNATTPVDSSTGKINYEQIEFSADNVDRLIPYLGINDATLCRNLAEALIDTNNQATTANCYASATGYGGTGGTANAPFGDYCANKSQFMKNCAIALINHIRGKDAFDADGDFNCNEERDWKLGDIFHSSPVVVEPPLEDTSVYCTKGLSNQCLVSLTRTGTAMDANAYATYRNRAVSSTDATPLMHRKKIALVGANDGMLHAFLVASWDSTNSRYNDKDASNLGVEQWAFIPPNLLPKLPLMVDNRVLPGSHTFYVDGTAMVRDVWVDGSGSVATLDNTKQSGEYHTMAVVGERRGGTSFFGIDVTDPANPQFKWTYPNTKLGFGVAGKTGESWNDYLPLAPPIGPVRYKPSATATTQERWIVALNGGADPTQQRGQGLSLVDVWTGDALKTFGFGAALADSDDPLKEMKFSFAGAVALYGWGSTDSSPNMNFNGYFFDTAVAGDTGGNLWAFRFNDADPSKWTAARFLSPGANVSARQPFYEMPALFATDTGWLRAVIGSGDRFALHEPGVAPCTAGNPMACVRAGCKVALASHEHGYDFGSSSSVVVNPEFTCTPATSGTSGTTSAGCSATFTSASVSDTGSYTACNTPSIHSTTPTGYTESRFVLDCQTVSGNKYEYKIREGCSSSSTSFCTSGNDFTCETSPRKECKWNGSDHSCNLSSTERISPTTATNAGFNALYSVRVFGGTRGIFNKLGSSTTDTDSAKKFDTNRLTLASLKTPTNTTGTVIPINPLSTTVPTSLASSTDDGWWLPYISAANTSGYTYDQAERTSGGASVFNGCAFVNTIKASAATASGSGTCATSQVNSQARYYHVHAVTGGLCPSPTSFSSCTDPANFANCVRNSVTSPVPPPTPQIAVFVSIDTGQISFNVVNSTPGQSPTANRVGANSDPFQWIYSVEVPRAVHQCRHPTDGTNACQ